MSKQVVLGVSYNILKFEVDQTNTFGDIACPTFCKILADRPPLLLPLVAHLVDRVGTKPLPPPPPIEI